MARFLQTLNSNPFLGNLVKTLTLWHTELPVLLESFPFAFAGKLTQVEEMRLLCDNRLQSLGFHMDDAFLATMSNFSSISELVLEGTKFDTFRDFARFTCSLPSLSSLKCRCLSWSGDDPNVSAFAGVGYGLKLTSLLVRYFPVGLNFYLTLLFLEVYEVPLIALVPLLYASGECLQHLTIYISKVPIGMEQYLRSIQLKSLRSLYISVELIPAIEDRLIIPILSHLTSPDIHDIHLLFQAHHTIGVHDSRFDLPRLAPLTRSVHGPISPTWNVSLYAT
ncbi:hypothetical protein A0H81_05666 [Grifola frondosa]|uniref:Uncharacterized protein n=1 Tax=Grifola frondosa TaxID=5627 RepID=A0A1C7MDJ7_GRIFR|nr:hypothetical protein A0H81_05666 [Grifola frondosa]